MSNATSTNSTLILARARFILWLSLCVGSSWVAANPIEASAPAQSANQGTQADTNSFVKIAVKKIAEAEPHEMQLDRAKKLSQWVAGHPEEVSTTDVTALASLMSSPDDGVRFWIAGALGRLGGKAVSAAPQLQAALQERPCSNTPMTSAGAIRLALSRIGVEPVSAVCTDPFGT